MAELLIALAILGVIAIFTIPKVLQSQQDSRYKAAGLEITAAISSALDTHRHKGLLTPLTSSDQIAQYLNYVKDYTGLIDNYASSASPLDCSLGWVRCLALHNGGVLYYNTGVACNFGGNGPTNAVWFVFDPDGKSTGTPRGALQIFSYYNGRITYRKSIEPNTQDCTGTTDPQPWHPSWFPD